MATVRFRHWLPRMLPKNIQAITIYPNVYLRENHVDITLLRHEYAHLCQIERVGAIKFYLVYAWEYIVNLLRYWDNNIAYHKISFEIEAYGIQHDIYNEDFRCWLLNIVKVPADE